MTRGTVTRGPGSGFRCHVVQKKRLESSPFNLPSFITERGILNKHRVLLTIKTNLRAFRAGYTTSGRSFSWCLTGRLRYASKLSTSSTTWWLWKSCLSQRHRFSVYRWFLFFGIGVDICCAPQVCAKTVCQICDPLIKKNKQDFYNCSTQCQTRTRTSVLTAQPSKKRRSFTPKPVMISVGTKHSILLTSFFIASTSRWEHSIYYFENIFFFLWFYYLVEHLSFNVLYFVHL